MAFTKEQMEEVKKQIFEQTKHLPEDRRKAIEAQIETMSPEQLELFVRQQTSTQKGQASGENKGIFRMIIDGDIPSKKIEENKESVAVISKRAISKGHVLIIPKKLARDSKEIPSSAFSMAKKISKKIISKLKASSTEIQTETAFGETIINIIPVYDKPVNINSPRYEVGDEEISELNNLLKFVKKPKVIKINKKPQSQANTPKLKMRIP